MKTSSLPKGKRWTIIRIITGVATSALVVTIALRVFTSWVEDTTKEIPGNSHLPGLYGGGGSAIDNVNLISRFNFPLTPFIATTFLMVLIGIGFFFLREYFRLYYACIELGVAIAICFHTLSVVNASFFSIDPILKIMTCIYIVVRACDNYKKWAEDEKKKVQQVTMTMVTV